MFSSLYTGEVRHRRFMPVQHQFRQSLFLMYLDLQELDQLFDRRWLWSSRRPALAWFRRSDHLGDPSQPLDAAVRDLVDEQLGQRPSGPVRLLTHLRYFGYVLNPVSLYYCFDATGQHIEAIVAEVTNTPWGERHCYVLDARNAPQSPLAPIHFEHAKEFHVSPFQPMTTRYRWGLNSPGEQLSVQIQVWQDDQPLFDADLHLHRRPISTRELTRTLLRYPFMTARIAFAIYWQALRLRWKGAPFFPHPRRRSAGPAGSSAEYAPSPSRSHQNCAIAGRPHHESCTVAAAATQSHPDHDSLLETSAP